MHMYDFTMFLRPFNIPYAPDTHRMRAVKGRRERETGEKNLPVYCIAIVKWQYRNPGEQEEK